MRHAPLSFVLLLVACSADHSTTGNASDTSPIGGADGSATGETPDDVSADSSDADNGDGSGATAPTEEERLRALLDPAPCELASSLTWSPLPQTEPFDGARRYSPISSINVDRGVASLFATPEHAALLANRRSRRAAALASCAGDKACLQNGFAWSDDERDQLAALLAPAQPIAEALSREAVETGYPFGLEVPAEERFLPELVALEVTLQNGAVARAIGELDPTVLPALVAEVEASASSAPEEGGRLATTLLRAAGRDEAFRYGPDAAVENRAVMEAIPGIDFGAYPYTAILVPGQGPTDDTTALNPAGIYRINLAIARWRAGLAPLLLVSGGHVHPDKTPFSEAIEMRRYLIDELGVPAEAIVVDPYARHTTTNIRNAARVLQGVGVPMDRPILVTSDLLQLAGIAFGLDARCEEELGFVPWQSLARLDSYDACALLTPDSQRLDRGDTLDP